MICANKRLHKIDFGPEAVQFSYYFHMIICGCNFDVWEVKILIQVLLFVLVGVAKTPKIQ